MAEENPNSAAAPPGHEAEKKPGEEGDAPRQPSTPPSSSSRREDSAPPHRGASSDAQDKVAEAAPTGPPNAPDGRSFSQLLAGAMAAPSQAQASLGTRHPPPPPILTVPVVAVPCFLATSAMTESPGFPEHFAMTHQAVLATVTAQAQMQLQPSYPAVSADSMTNSFPQSMLSAVSSVSLQNIPASASVSETISSDLYHWRKYGQKQVKSSENSRSYYRCTDSSCFAKKKVERSPDGSIVQTIYGGQHNHEPSQKYKYTRERLAQSAVHLGEGESLGESNIDPKESNPSASKNEQNSNNETPEQHLYCSSDCEVDTRSRNEEDVTDGPNSKRRLIEGAKSPSTPTQKSVREYVVRTETDARHLSDGYRWRKYGQKLVKGNPNPRSYYRCTYDGCLVRKHVEKVPHDEKALLITYEGQHNHDHPTSKYSSELSPRTPKSSPATVAVDKQPTTGDALSDEKSSEDPIVSKVDGKLADDKKSEHGGNNAFESAQALLSNGVNSSSGEGADRTTSDSMKPSLLNENPIPVSVHSSGIYNLT